ncbi:MAG: sigma-70 family RNA polymerase sigma factor [Candidatus Magasanikbacteria bacterium]|nr:sigma-70 family RNA polymerase sigma factor [Candidatus Magasanikbacteria bacterium]
MSKTPSDQELLYQVKTAADPEAYAALYDKYIQQIYRFVFFKVSSREEAEDIASEVFLKAWQYFQEGKAIKSFSGLLYRIARNSIIDWYRKRAGSQKIEALAARREAIEPGDGGRWYAELHTSLDAGVIVNALKQLKQEYQEVITLRYIDELSIEEIAEITGKRGLTVRVMIHRALKRLRQKLG